MIFFQRNVQNKLVQIMDSLEDEKRFSTVSSKDKTDEIVSRNYKGEILFLVDVPTERKGSSIDLYFKSESRIYGPLKSSEEDIHLEDSILWTALSKNFLASIGKIRVFCHPDIIETCSTCLTRLEIENTLEQVCSTILST